MRVGHGGLGFGADVTVPRFHGTFVEHPVAGPQQHEHGDQRAHAFGDFLNRAGAAEGEHEDHSHQAGAEQTDEQLLANVNAAFGTEIPSEDFVKIMQSVRAVNIDTSHYVDPSTKNNLDLVQWAIAAEKAGWGYVWGACGQVLTESALAGKIAQYPNEVGGQEDFIRTHWLGRRCADCVGFIKGYGWLDAETQEIEYGTNGMPDIGADAMYANATEKGTIDTIPEISGLAVWHEGHIGIYVGNGQVIHASGTKIGVIQTPIGASGWTHWLKIPYINYLETEEGTP